jgi:hypothetical protein
VVCGDCPSDVGSIPTASTTARAADCLSTVRGAFGPAPLGARPGACGDVLALPSHGKLWTSSAPLSPFGAPRRPFLPSLLWKLWTTHDPSTVRENKGIGCPSEEMVQGARAAAIRPQLEKTRGLLGAGEEQGGAAVPGAATRRLRGDTGRPGRCRAVAAEERG